MSENDNRREEFFYKKIDLPEKEALEIDKELRHLELDLQYDGGNDEDLVLKFMSKASKQDMYRAFLYGRILFTWGYETAEEEIEGLTDAPIYIIYKDVRGVLTDKFNPTKLKSGDDRIGVVRRLKNTMKKIEINIPR